MRNLLRAAWRRSRVALGRALEPGVGQLRHYPPRPLRVPARYRRPAALPRWPTISIVTPVLDGQPFLERTIRSVLDQEYPALEHIIQDGGSRDGSLEVARRFASRLARLASERDSGQSDALNRGFQHATGEILGYLNSDDLLLPGALGAVAVFLSRHPEVDVVYGHRVLIDHEDRDIGTWVLPPHDDEAIRWIDPIPQETMFWRRRIWDAVGRRFDENLHFAMDWDLVLRFRAIGARFARMPRFLGAFRVHDQQKTSARMEALGRQEILRLLRREHGAPVEAAAASRQARRYLLRQAVHQRLYELGLLRH